MNAMPQTAFSTHPPHRKSRRPTDARRPQAFRAHSYSPRPLFRNQSVRAASPPDLRREATRSSSHRSRSASSAAHPCHSILLFSQASRPRHCRFQSSEMRKSSPRADFPINPHKSGPAPYNRCRPPSCSGKFHTSCAKALKAPAFFPVRTIPVPFSAAETLQKTAPPRRSGAGGQRQPSSRQGALPCPFGAPAPPLTYRSAYRYIS